MFYSIPCISVYDYVPYYGYSAACSFDGTPNCFYVNTLFFIINILCRIRIYNSVPFYGSSTAYSFDGASNCLCKYFVLCRFIYFVCNNNPVGSFLFILCQEHIVQIVCTSCLFLRDSLNRVVFYPMSAEVVLQQTIYYVPQHMSDHFILVLAWNITAPTVRCFSYGSLCTVS